MLNGLQDTTLKMLMYFDALTYDAVFAIKIWFHGPCIHQTSL